MADGNQTYGDHLKYWITKLRTWNQHNVVGQLYFSLKMCRASLVVQWLGETSLILGPGRVHMATKPVHRNSWACAPQGEKPPPSEAPKSSSHSPQPEKARMHQRGPSANKK